MKKVLPFLVFLLVFSACAPVGISISKNSPQKKFGDDAHYFLALQAADSGDEAEAQRLFKISRKKSNSLIAKRSAEALTLLGSVSDRIESAQFLAENYTDENSLVTACQELFNHSEYAKIISLTDGISLADSKNELIKLRLLSLAQKRDSRFDSEFFKWYVSRPLSSEHLESYATYIALLNEKKQKYRSRKRKIPKRFEQTKPA